MVEWKSSLFIAYWREILEYSERINEKSKSIQDFTMWASEDDQSFGLDFKIIWGSLEEVSYFMISRFNI